MTDREVVDYAYGPNWGQKMESRVEKLESERAMIRADRQMLTDIKRGVDGLGSKWIEFQENDKKRYAKLERRMEDLEGAPSSSGEDDEEFSGVTDVSELQRKGRRVRAQKNKLEDKNKRNTRNNRIGVPALLVAGAGLLEAIRQVLHALGK